MISGNGLSRQLVAAMSVMIIVMVGLHGAREDADGWRSDVSEYADAVVFCSVVVMVVFV